MISSSSDEHSDFMPDAMEPFDDQEAEDPEVQAGDTGEIRLVLPSDQIGERLDRVLARLLPDYSRSRIQQWIEDQQVTVDGQPSRTKAIVLGGEEVVVAVQSVPRDAPFTAENLPLDVLHQDDAVIVLNKPAGLVVHPAAGNWTGTLLNGLLHHDPALVAVPRAGIVHRLDKDTSGLMVVARTIESQTHLVRQMQARSVQRQYLALAWGEPQVSGTIDAAIARHPRDRLRMAVSQSAAAKPAVTRYRCIGRGFIQKHPVSLMHCRLETGRTHQIRVHFQSIGFPLVGDPLYGKTHLAGVFHRQALHAWQLAFDHPLGGQPVAWRTEPPGDMTDLLERAGLTDWDRESR